MTKKILVINPGSTSTRLAVYEDDNEIIKQDLFIDAEKLANMPLMIDQLPLRLASVYEFIDQYNVNMNEIDIIVSRGGSMNGVPTGAVKIDEHVLTILEYAPRTQHASSLGSFMAADLAKKYDIPAIFYDAPSSNDADEKIKYTGIPGVKRWVSSHCLNSKMVAREVAEKIGKKYEDVNIIVAHLGGGITVSFHNHGKLVDSVEDDAGPMSPQRSGRLPSNSLISMCFSGKYSSREMQGFIRGKGGLVAYFGTQDLRKVENLADNGDKTAKDLYWLMHYQISKAIGELSAVDSGNVDAIVLTGGIAASERFTDMIKNRVSYIAPVYILPGEREMLALARGGIRVLNGDEKPHEYRWLPLNCDTLDDVKRLFSRGMTSMPY